MGSLTPFISTALSVIGTIQGGMAQQAQAEGDAKANEYNAQVASRNAKIARQQTASDVEKADKERRLRLGQNIAASGASGVIGGSALDIMSDNVTQESLDILNIEREGILRAQNYQSQAGMYTASAANTRAQAPSTASVILGGASAGLGTYLSAGGI